mmetsp:Transcript_33292/g.31758  ORF Transcript_33292/g.31758 Transcript_33292/m.31758 type:complete len:120 (-) Transcript_33292:175-534(-)|eukprot:CAMPEP_0119048298 /NCGR_PEP_ID=MMETSP1177-20130426/58179_1 /TAXON_ID=2985 /ORGANISM="Ochromonas sp, Strain CCMP1899" /LENGTH=119 /DNA_ID=CAMNT_0007023999 /DNA_START=472 /DNA_END=831 /DNA_ORIENTATION=-
METIGVDGMGAEIEGMGTIGVEGMGAEIVEEPVRVVTEATAAATTNLMASVLSLKDCLDSSCCLVMILTGSLTGRENVTGEYLVSLSVDLLLGGVSAIVSILRREDFGLEDIIVLSVWG